MSRGRPTCTALALPPSRRLILGDVIMEINGKKVKGASDLYRVLDKCVVGDTVQVQVLRGNATEQLSIVLEPN